MAAIIREIKPGEKWIHRKNVSTESFTNLQSYHIGGSMIHESGTNFNLIEVTVYGIGLIQTSPKMPPPPPQEVEVRRESEPRQALRPRFQ
jgi:hypothetical protein